MVSSCKADEICTDTIKGGDFTWYFLKEWEEDEPQLDFHPTVTADLKLFGIYVGPVPGVFWISVQTAMNYSYSLWLFEPVIALVVVLLTTNM